MTKETIDIIATPYDRSLYEALDAIVSAQPEPVPPGLDHVIDEANDTIVVLSRGRVIGSVAYSVVLARAAEIELLEHETFWKLGNRGVN